MKLINNTVARCESEREREREIGRERTSRKSARGNYHEIMEKTINAAVYRLQLSPTDWSIEEYNVFYTVHMEWIIVYRKKRACELTE